MKIIGYTYEADHHCVECTKTRSNAGGFGLLPKQPVAKREHDEHGVPYAVVDNEGNRVHPIFSTDELPCDISDENGGYSPVVCGDCFIVIRERD